MMLENRYLLSFNIGEDLKTHFMKNHVNLLTISDSFIPFFIIIIYDVMPCGIAFIHFFSMENLSRSFRHGVRISCFCRKYVPDRKNVTNYNLIKRYFLAFGT